MKTTRLMLLVSVAILLAGAFAPGVARQNGAGAGPGPVIQEQSLSYDEAAMLLFMREEEKLARDVYITLFGQWGNLVFDNISVSEQRHMDTMESMVEKHGLTDPVVDDTVGVFVNGELDSLYDELVADGLQDHVAALHVGALIEEVDIEDIQVAINGTSHQDLIRAYENLMRGSRNHLRAFVGQIENLGIVYEARILDQSVVDAIVDSPLERGGRGNR